MREKLLSCGRMVVVCAVALCLMGGNDPKDRNYKGGDGDAVKGWGWRHYQDATTSGQPLCVYVYDAKNNRNMAAKYFEASVLNNAEVKEKLKGFLCLKIKGDGSDGKNWPQGWRERCVNGAVLVLATSDMVRTTVYDKLNKESLTPAVMVAQLKGTLQYEQQLKELLAKAGVKEVGAGPAKAGMPPAEEKAEKVLPGLDAEKKAEKKKPDKPKLPDGPTEE